MTAFVNVFVNNKCIRMEIIAIVDFVALIFDKGKFAAAFRAIPVPDDHAPAKRIECVHIQRRDAKIFDQREHHIIHAHPAGCLYHRQSVIVRDIGKDVGCNQFLAKQTGEDGKVNRGQLDCRRNFFQVVINLDSHIFRLVARVSPVRVGLDVFADDLVFLCFFVVFNRDFRNDFAKMIGTVL